MITGNEPAMPFTGATENTLSSGHLTGLSIRQHFTAMAMQGIMSGIYSSKEAWNSLQNAAFSKGVSVDDLVAENSTDAANALINALNS